MIKHELSEDSATIETALWWMDTKSCSTKEVQETLIIGINKYEYGLELMIRA